MFNNIKARLAPNSFDLERFLVTSKRYANVSASLAKLITEKLDKQPSVATRGSKLVIAVAYYGTTVIITDEDLATNLYTAITSKSFKDKLTNVCDKLSVFSDLKFFVNKRTKKVCFIYYQCNVNVSKDFIKNIYCNIELVRDLFSTENYTLNIDYEKFFKHFFPISAQTSFLTCFFISIVKEIYEFTPVQLYKVATLFLEYALKHSKPLYKNRTLVKGDFPTLIPGMYINKLDKIFNEDLLPRNICINILKLLSNSNAFNSYSDFFASYNETDIAYSSYSHLQNSGDFVFDDSILQSSATIVDETNDFITYTVADVVSKVNKYVVIKIKDTANLNRYLYLLNNCVQCNCINNMSVISNFDESSYYLLFEPIKESLGYKPLKELISSLADDFITSIIMTIAKVNWNFTLTANTDWTNCFLSNCNKLYINPLHISKIDFEHSNSSHNCRLFILQVIKEFVETHSICLDKLYNYSFMKILPFTFATNLINYLKTGYINISETESWGKILLSNLDCNIAFLDNLPTVHANRISFFEEVTSDSRVQAIIQKKVHGSYNDYVNSFESLAFIKEIGLQLSDYTLNKLFSEDTSRFLTPTDVIICKDFIENGNYKIIGVIWNNHNLRTIGQLVTEKTIDTKMLYIMITSLYSTIGDKRTFDINESNIKDLLVSEDFFVYLNRNVIKATNKKFSKLPAEKYFEMIVLLFKSLFDKKDWESFDHFTFKELTSTSLTLWAAARHMQICKEHNHYHLKDCLCGECKKIYSIVETSNLESVYNNNNYLFYNAKENLTLACENAFSITSRTISEVKLGLEHGLYDKFFFKPQKLALANSNLFGVIFSKIDFAKLLTLEHFSNIFRLKFIFVMYKKLLPYILDGSFIATDLSIFKSIAMHKDYSGEILILNIPLMSCSYVLSKDAKQIEETKKVFAEFLIEYITSDDSLKLVRDLEYSGIYELINDIKNLRFDENVLKSCLNTVCDIHKVPISDKHSVCPLCLKDGIDNEFIITNSDHYFDDIRKHQPIYEGGEATLYPYGNDEVQKLFKSDVDWVLKSKIIGKALQKAPFFHEFNSSHPDIQFVTINKVLYAHDNGSAKLKGYTEDYIKDSFKISSLKNKEFVNSHGYTTADVLSLLIKVCIGIEFLHSIGAYIGDLNGGNILIKGKNVYFIDLDGMSYDDVKNHMYTDTYIYPPSAESKNITKADDWYSLAIQAFYYLTFSHPFRGIRENSSNIPISEIERMRKGYSVLGNHGIKPPSISIGWQFMPKYLVQFFLDTFEGKKRESMKDVLIRYQTELNKMQANDLKFTEVIRKFSCKIALSYNTYIDTDGNLRWCENILISFSTGHITCIFSGDNIVFINQYSTIVLNDKDGTISKFNAMDSDYNRYNLVRAANEKLFYVSSDLTTIYMKYYDIEGNERIKTISRATNNKVLDFWVKNENKFIFLEESSKKHIDVYCNLEKLISIDASSLADNYFPVILYDSVYDSYLILLCDDSQNIGVFISKDGSYKQVQFEAKLNNKGCLFKNILYFVDDGWKSQYKIDEKIQN